MLFGLDAGSYSLIGTGVFLGVLAVIVILRVTAHDKNWKAVRVGFFVEREKFSPKPPAEGEDPDRPPREPPLAPRGR